MFIRATSDSYVQDPTQPGRSDVLRAEAGDLAYQPHEVPAERGDPSHRRHTEVDRLGHAPAEIGNDDVRLAAQATLDEAEGQAPSDVGPVQHGHDTVGAGRSEDVLADRLGIAQAGDIGRHHHDNLPRHDNRPAHRRRYRHRQVDDDIVELALQQFEYLGDTSA